MSHFSILYARNDIQFVSRYDGVSAMVPDQFSHLLEEIHKLETELGHLPQKWKVLWDKLELPNTDSLAVSRNYYGYRYYRKTNFNY